MVVLLERIAKCLQNNKIFANNELFEIFICIQH